MNNLTPVCSVNRQLWSVPKKVSEFDMVLHYYWWKEAAGGSSVYYSLFIRANCKKNFFSTWIFSDDSSCFCGSFNCRSWTLKLCFAKIINYIKTEYLMYNLPLCLFALWLFHPTKCSKSIIITPNLISTACGP